MNTPSRKIQSSLLGVILIIENKSEIFTAYAIMANTSPTMIPPGGEQNYVLIA